MSDTQTQDNIVYENSMGDYTPTEKPFLKKDMVYVIDDNSSSDYSRNQISWSTTSLSNSGRFIDYANGFLSIPLVMVHTRTTGAALSDAEADAAIRFKASSLNIINNISIEYGNVNVVQQSNNIASYLIFKKHSTVSLDYANTKTHTGYRKDDSDSWTYTATNGLHNNDLTKNKSLAASPWVVEKDAVVKKLSNMEDAGENVRKTTGADDKTNVYYYDCILPLKDLSSFFESMPLVRGANLNIVCTLNQSSALISNTDANVVSTVMTNQGSSCPIMRGKLQTGTAYSEDISVKVCKNGDYQHRKQQCRLYVNQYVLSPQQESRFLSQGTRTVAFTDVMTVSLKDIGEGGTSFQNIISNSVNHLKRLILVVSLSSSANGTIGVTPSQSIYSSEPSTCSPYLIKNFQCKVSGVNLYDSTQQYSYESFLNEFDKFGAYAGFSDEVTSSQISLKDWNSTYGYIVCDLSRGLPTDASIPKSIEISGQVASPLMLSVTAFVETEKFMTIDLVTGARLS